MNLYQYDNYKAFLKDAVSQRKSIHAHFNLSYLANKTGIQRTYLSHVMAGRAHLNSDQLFLICQALQLDQSDSDYLQLLLEFERCQLASRKKILQEAINLRRISITETERALSLDATVEVNEALAEYYSNPYCSITHMFLLMPEFQTNPSSLVQRLQISEKQFSDIVQILCKCRLVRLEVGRIELLQNEIHLRQDHPFAKTHSLNFRTLAIARNWSNSSSQDYQFTATVAGNKEHFSIFRKDLVEAIRRLADAVAKVPNDQTNQIFQINLDLFEY